MTFLKTAAATAALVIIGAGAQAATFDFATDAETFESSSGYEGTFDQVYESNVDSDAAFTAGLNTQDGITVNAYSYDDSWQVDTHPFMDSYTSLPAGLGVCSSGFTGDISNCNGSGDDNLLYPEILELVFSVPVWLTDLLVRDADHNLITDTDAVEINGDNYAAVNGVVQGLDALLFTTYFYFTSAESCVHLYDTVAEYECRAETPIYLSSISAAVPIPAAGFLLLGGLGGLMAFRRRKS